jgi:hypothetical protein
MSKNVPKTSFIARNEAAMPPVPARKARRETPSFLAAASVRSSTRACTRFCRAVCGSGAYSPLETICVGIALRGVPRSARAQRATSSSVSR